MVFAALFLAVSTTGFAIEPKPDSPQSAGGGLDFLYVQGPTKEHNERLSYFATYRRKIISHVRADGFLFVSPETDKQTSDVQVAESFYTLAPAVSLTYSYLFRYVATAGPMLTMGSSTYNLKGKEESFSFWDYGLLNRYSLEYAFGHTFEMALTIGHQYRMVDAKWDYMFGLSAFYYF